MDTSSINAQSIFDDNAATLKLSWLTGHEGWERGFSADTVANATSSADLVGHLLAGYRLTLAEDNPTPGGDAKGLWNACPEIPLPRWGRVFARKAPPKKCATY